LVTSEGAPATTPPSVTADFLRQIGVLRIGLAVTATSVTDQLVQSALVDRYYVVRRSDGTLFVDLVLSAPALARVSTSGSPGTVAVELEPGGPPYPATPAVGGLFVVTSPTGESGEAPIPVSGYGRPFEASVVVQVIQDGTVVTEASTHTADYAETWGEFAVEVATPARGPVQLFVGEFSAEDGSPQGVVIPLILP
jgi:hypothetical protein